MTIASLKDQLLAQMQEWDTALQTMMKVRSEMYRILSGLSDGDIPDEIGIPLTFYENGQIISWGDDSEHFTPQTFRLLQQLWLAPTGTKLRFMLSYESATQTATLKPIAPTKAVWTDGYYLLASSQIPNIVRSLNAPHDPAVPRHVKGVEVDFIYTFNPASSEHDYFAKRTHDHQYSPRRQ
jgi:hypothetical protein